MRVMSIIQAVIVFASMSLVAQSPIKPNASEIYHELQKLNFLGSALYVAAHPDDENTRLISFLANDVKARTAYLSLTRGDGGQNLIGPELRELLGVIRTHELMEARKIDGGMQYFTRANDFGFSKHPGETLKIWETDEVVSDVVRIIRKFKPDVIINRFNHRNPGSTHGHHTASAMLSFDAFDWVGDASKFPESAEAYGAWQPKRLFFNTSWWFYGSRENFEKADKTNLLEVETGNYFTNLGLSNGEIASLSRSMHKSQGFGSIGSRGNQTEYLEFLKGDFPKNKSNIFDGIDTSWSRIEGGKAICNILYEVEKHFNFKDPSKHVLQLTKAYNLLNKLPESHWKSIKLPALAELIANCSGLYLEAISSKQSVAPNGALTVTIEALNRSNTNIQLNGLTSPVIQFPSTFAPIPLKNNQVYTTESTSNTFSGKEYTSPYWLRESGTLGMYKVSNKNSIGLPRIENNLPVNFQLTVEGQAITLQRNIVYKYRDRVKGEVYQPLEILPVATASVEEKVIIFDSATPREIPVTVTSGKENVSGTLILRHPEGWKVTPDSQTFELKEKGSSKSLLFTVTPPTNQSKGQLMPLLQVGDIYSDKELVTLDYDHIPYQNILLPAVSNVVRIPIEKKGEQIGYINGAGDAIPQSLKQIGYQVTTIEPNDITLENLKKFDAIVIGIRAYNTVSELAFKQSVLNEYVNQGGTLVLQYNTSRGLVTENLGPYPITLSRDRVTNEFSPVQFLVPEHPVLNTPNKITLQDFEGWVQERGLYFPNQWDSAYTPILGMNDEGQAQTKGALLIATYGKGYYVYTGLSFFRELPVGVPGAYRLFANILSLGK